MPNKAMAYTRRAIAYGKSGQHKNAIADCNIAIRLNPADAKAYRNRGLAYQFTGKRDAAIADFRKALSLGEKKARENLREIGAYAWE